MTEVQPKQIAIIDTGVPDIPLGNPDDPTTQYGKVISLIDSIQELKKGQSFTIDNKAWRRRATAAASYAKISITTRALKDGKLRIRRKA